MKGIREVATICLDVESQEKRLTEEALRLPTAGMVCPLRQSMPIAVWPSLEASDWR